jgi:hypothetical protein
MLRPLATSPVTTAVLCGVLCLSLFTLHANVVLGESLVEYILTREADTVETIWYGLYTVGGVCLLGVVPLVLYARYSVVTPAIAVVVLSAGYLYLADTEVLYLFLLSTPLFVSALLTVGTVEYLLRTVLVESASLSGAVTVALLLGVPHVVVSAATFGELSPLPLVLSVGSLFVVAVPVLLFLQFDAVAPAVGAVVGLVFILVVHWERLPTEYSFLSTQLLVPIFLFGGVEYLLRSTNAVGA